jgi:hypothetical protein
MLSVSNLRFSIGTKIDWVWPCIDDVETRSNAVVRALTGRKRAYFNRIHGASLAISQWRFGGLRHQRRLRATDQIPTSLQSLRVIFS